MNPSEEFISLVEGLAASGPRASWFRTALDDLAALLDCERVFLYRYRRSGGFRVVAARNRDREDISRPETRMSHFIVQRVASTGTSEHVDDARHDRRYRAEEALAGSRPARSIHAYPLRVGGALRGGVYADHRLREFRSEPQTGALRLRLALLEAALRLRSERENVVRALRGRAPAIVASQPDVAEDARRVRAARSALLEEALDAENFHGVVSANADLRDLFDTLRTVPASDLPVLVRGETGVGKGLVASAVHASSSRSRGPLVVVDCGAIPDGLIESELLGHARGAFTGADSEHAGAFEQAHGGSLLLDEVASMSDAMQTKLLRVLADGNVRRLGEKSPRAVDVRLICTTAHDLEALVERGSFRRDLFFRLKGLDLEIPALRERPEDVLPLVEHLAGLHVRSAGGRAPEIGRDARLRLLEHDWPGNVRELENEVRRWLGLGLERVGVEDLQLTGGIGSSMRGGSAVGGSRTLDEVIHSAEIEAITVALRRCAGNKSEAARRLGITRKALYRRLAKYGLE